MPDTYGGEGVGDLGGVSCTRKGKRIHVFHMIPRVCWRGGWGDASILLLYLAHVSLQEACSLR